MTNDMLRRIFIANGRDLTVSFDGEVVGSGSAKAAKWNIKVGRNPFMATKQPKAATHESGIGKVLAISMKTPVGEGLALLLVANPEISCIDARAIRIEDITVEDKAYEILYKPGRSNP